MNGGGSYQHSGDSFPGPHQAQGNGRCSVLGVSSGMRLAILKQGISAVLACSVTDTAQNPISHALTDLAVQGSRAQIPELLCSILFTRSLHVLYSD